MADGRARLNSFSIRRVPLPEPLPHVARTYQSPITQSPLPLLEKPRDPRRSCGIPVLIATSFIGAKTTKMSTFGASNPGTLPTPPSTPVSTITARNSSAWRNRRATGLSPSSTFLSRPEDFLLRLRLPSSTITTTATRPSALATTATFTSPIIDYANPAACAAHLPLTSAYVQHVRAQRAREAQLAIKMEEEEVEITLEAAGPSQSYSDGPAASTSPILTHPSVSAAFACADEPPRRASVPSMDPSASLSTRPVSRPSISTHPRSSPMATSILRLPAAEAGRWMYPPFPSPAYITPDTHTPHPGFFCSTSGIMPVMRAGMPDASTPGSLRSQPAVPMSMQTTTTPKVDPAAVQRAITPAAAPLLPAAMQEMPVVEHSATPLSSSTVPISEGPISSRTRSSKRASAPISARTRAASRASTRAKRSSPYSPSFRTSGSRSTSRNSRASRTANSSTHSAPGPGTTAAASAASASAPPRRSTASARVRLCRDEAGMWMRRSERVTISCA